MVVVTVKRLRDSRRITNRKEIKHNKTLLTTLLSSLLSSRRYDGRTVTLTIISGCLSPLRPLRFSRMTFFPRRVLKAVFRVHISSATTTVQPIVFQYSRCSSYSVEFGPPNCSSGNRSQIWYLVLIHGKDIKANYIL